MASELLVSASGIAVMAAVVGADMWLTDYSIENNRLRWMRTRDNLYKIQLLLRYVPILNKCRFVYCASTTHRLMSLIGHPFTEDIGRYDK